MVAAGAGAAAGEGEVAGEGVGDAHGRDEALGVLHDAQDVAAALALQDALDGAGLALQGVDALGLLAGFIDG